MGKKTKNTLILLVAVFLFLFVFNFALAAVDKLDNPLGDIDDPRVVIGNIIKALLGIVGSLALAIFVYGGFNWVISAGNEEKIKKGKDMIIWATFGLAVIFASYALVNFVIGAVAGSGGSSSPETSSSAGSPQDESDASTP